jgi:short-subunit dehydrogenase
MGRQHNGLLLAVAGLGVALAVRERARQRRAITFPGKTVLITGGSRGLGLELARQFADKGARLALCARDLGELERAREELTQRGAEVFLLPCDITDRDEVQEVIHSVQDRLGPVDILVNNAGVIQVGPMEEMTLEDYEKAMQVHFWGPLLMTQAVLPGMRRQKRGRIVNIASIGGKISVPHLLPYSASKFALVGLSEGMRAELMKDNIYVTTICPGLMRTGSHVHATFKGQHKKEYTLFSIANALPLNSIDSFQAAKDIIHACKYGDAEVTLSIPAKAAALFHGLFPGLTADLFGLLNQTLPGPGGIGSESAEGKDSQTALSPSWVTSLSDEAAQHNNEVTT